MTLARMVDRFRVVWSTGTRRWPSSWLASTTFTRSGSWGLGQLGKHDTTLPAWLAGPVNSILMSARPNYVRILAQWLSSSTADSKGLWWLAATCRVASDGETSLRSPEAQPRPHQSFR
jgi:hypothetical protein